MWGRISEWRRCGDVVKKFNFYFHVLSRRIACMHRSRSFKHVENAGKTESGGHGAVSDEQWVDSRRNTSGK